jgi:hypothetical protein
MRRLACLVFVLTIATASAWGKKPNPHWLKGKILDDNRARYFAGMFNNSSSETSANGSFSATADDTQVRGTYAGSSSTSTSGVSTPIYRVYDNLMIEGDDTVYVTSERIRWRWSKSAHVAINEFVQYYVEGRKLHILDDDGKEHPASIVKEIRKPVHVADSAVSIQPETKSAPQHTEIAMLQASVSIDSTPSGADIEIDGVFVGNTPSTVDVPPGIHGVTVKKKGFAEWTKKMNVTRGSVHLNAELEAVPTAQ